MTGFHQHKFVFDNLSMQALTHAHILKNSAALPSTDQRGYFDIQPEDIAIDYACFKIQHSLSDFAKVIIRQDAGSLTLYCECLTKGKKLCEHQIQVLYNMMNRKDLRAYFDPELRKEQIRLVAADYGMQDEGDLDEFFQLEYVNKTLQITPKIKELIPATQSAFAVIENELVSKIPSGPANKDFPENRKTIVVLGQNRYYNHFFLELHEVQTTKEGKPKNPLVAVNPLDVIWKTNNPEVVKFYTAVSVFQNNFRKKNAETDIEGLKSIAANPAKLNFYFHNAAVSENIGASSILPVQVRHTAVDLELLIHRKDPFFHISGKLVINGVDLDLDDVHIRYDYFVLHLNTLYLIDREAILKTIEFFSRHNQKIVIHKSKFEEFRQNVLSRIEANFRITYSYLKPATPQQLQEQGFDHETEKIIYLEDLGDYILLTPVIRYGNVEVPVFSKRQIYSVDSHGNPFTVSRDEEAEIRFGNALLRQHADFADQPEREFFYLHKSKFQDEDWLLSAFQEWQDLHVTVLGFDKLTKNRLNPNRAKVSVHVSSGINWFDTTISVLFGKQKVTLKNLHKAVKNRSKYVQLGDGTQGILPQEWFEKFSKFFAEGEISEEVIRTPKINFASVSAMYEEALLSQETKDQIAFYQTAFNDFHAILPVKVPNGLKTSLREYQKQGLNWLNFLDDFGFGGCLADDMGLGKTIQIIAFLLLQRKKKAQNTNLIIVPTSLIFNWQAEIEKFAPSLKVRTIYGASRIREVKYFDQYEVILTSYGTLLADVSFLKKFCFNYIILDESQNIKNPESQRYKAARLLQSQNKLVLTGTPVENNTFDLYGQLSFACPGLLGNKTQFKDYYSTPIDRFKDNERARELQKKINPFILRRTKKQVATELPDKTEMVLYCEMGEEQRKVYNAYELEFYTYLNTKKEVDIPRISLHILQGLTKLRQICNSPALLNDDLYYGNESSKIAVLMEQIEAKSSGHKILVFSQFVSMLDLIKKELEKRNIGHEYLTGQTKDRAARVDNFQNNGQVRVFLISLKAGGTGLNLTEADYVYIVDPWWNPSVENQAIDRSYRIGQRKNVIAVRLICPGTIEEKILELQQSKKDLAEDLVKTDAAVLKTLSKKDLLNLVSPN
ncbi:ATP-dependent helicase [Dyadobacter flavalbus]|uniref:ATP-dependent helicase n=1 Tax=Dyadobacter flavalbus TaxID=2579942 RepID=A0A5M8Q8I2_9BACT|nr:DEAD/DEAH box helicase [Dyadobacter flavalbus]KAA6431448.1 ATP-dependent helicase [Dyadobacter flavalbus]